MKPALPSKPTALATRGASKNFRRPLASKALRMVPSVLLEMMPKDAPSARRPLSLGSNIAALSQSSTCLVLRAARSPGVAVKVPSKSKKTTAMPRGGVLKSSRAGEGDSGHSGHGMECSDMERKDISEPESAS